MNYASEFEKQLSEFLDRNNKQIQFRINELGIQIDEIKVKIDNVDKELFRVKSLKGTGSPEFSKERLTELKGLMKQLKGESDKRMLLIQEWEKRLQSFSSQINSLASQVKEHEVRRIKALKFQFLEEKIILEEKKWQQDVPAIPAIESLFGETLSVDVYAEFASNLDELQRAQGYSLIPINNWELRMLSIGRAMGLRYPELLSQHTAYEAQKKINQDYLKKFAE